MAMREATALKLLRYYVSMEAESERLSDCGVSVAAVDRYEEVLEILLDDLGFPPDQTGGQVLDRSPRARVFSRDMVREAAYSLSVSSTDDDLRGVLRAWSEMLRDVGRFYV